MAYTYSRNVIPLGDQTGRKQSIVEIPAEAASDKPGILSLVAVADGGTRTAYYYWTDSNGVFRQHTSIPTNQDSDGTAVVASGAASLALDNLAAVAINTSLTSDTDNTDDLGTATKTWRSAYIGTSVVFKEAGGNITITTDNPSAARAYSIPDAGAAASFMLDSGAANVIAYTKGTSTIAMAANADLSIATGITLSVTAACTLDQNLAVAGTPSFSTVTGGTTTLSAATIVNSTGAISFGDENLTTTGTINVASDNVNITLGASGATDARIFFDGSGNLKLYDSNLGTARSLTELYTGTALNPTVAGDLTIPDGNFTWTNATASETAVWTLAATTVDGIQINSSNTTADALQITANATTSGNVLSLIAVDATLAGGGGYIYCYDGAAQDFAVRRYGATTIAGVASTDVLTVTAGDVQITAGDIDIDLGIITVDNTADEGSSFKRNNATGTGPVLEVEDTHANGGVTFLVDSNVTDAIDAMQITHDGTGSGLNITGTAVTGTQLKVIGPASQTASSLIVDGTTGSWIGAATTGMLHLSSDGALVADASLLRISSTGAISAANDGACLEVIETGAAQATTYAVRIASTSNEALHVDTGLSLFDERVTITLADNTGPALAITNPDTTGNTNAVTITPSGSGAGLLISPQEADTMALSVVGKTASTVSLVKIDGSDTDGWYGANNVGMFHLVNDGTYAHVGSSLLYIGNSGVPQNDAQGYCLRIIDTGNAAAGTMAYPVYITSNDATVGGIYVSSAATGIALNVAAGTSNFGGIANFAAGLKTVVAVTDVADPPTNANMITAFGAAATAGAGFIGFLNDANGGVNTWLCVSSGTAWYYVAKLTAGA